MPVCSVKSVSLSRRVPLFTGEFIHKYSIILNLTWAKYLIEGGGGRPFGKIFKRRFKKGRETGEKEKREK